MTITDAQPAGEVETERLAPCPFCGRRDQMVIARTCDRTTPYNPADYAYPRVVCKCGVEIGGQNWGNPETAIAAWNRRPPADAGKADSVWSVIEKYRYRHQGPGDPARPPCEVCQFIAEIDAATRSVPPTPPVSEDAVEAAVDAALKAHYGDDANWDAGIGVRILAEPIARDAMWNAIQAAIPHMARGDQGAGAIPTIADENLCRARAMEQWEASLKRPDLSERDRVRGALDAYARQALAIALIAPPTDQVTALVEAAREVANELYALMTAVRFADPPKLFNGVKCHEARVPVEFVQGAEAAILKVNAALLPFAKAPAPDDTTPAKGD